MLCVKCAVFSSGRGVGVSGLGLGYTNPIGTGGVWEV